jgi:hypothetical protein
MTALAPTTNGGGTAPRHHPHAHRTRPRQLSRSRRRSHRTAVRIRHGEIEVRDLTDRQLAALVRVPVGPLSKALKNGNGGAASRELSDAQVDRVVAKLGAERVMAALDRLTRP